MTRKSVRPAVGVLAILMLLAAKPAVALEPIPDKLVVLTFDDSVKSQFTVVTPPILKKWRRVRQVAGADAPQLARR